MEDAERVVREIGAQWKQGVRGVVPGLIDPEIEIHSALAGGQFKGAEGVDAWAAEIDQQFEDWKLEIREIRTLADGRLIVEGSVHGRGRQSQIDLDTVAAWLVEVRGGRLLTVHNFIGYDAAERAEAQASG